MKNTRIIGLWLLLYTVSSVTLASTDLSAIPGGYDKKGITPFLVIALPEEMLAYRLASMNAAFDMVEKARKIAVENNEDATGSPLNKGKSRMMYEIAWAFVVKLYQQTSDTEVKKRILEKWDAPFSDKTAPIYLLRAQLNSLCFEGGHDFITPKLNELFLQTKDLDVLCSGFMIFDQYGEKEDIPILKKKLEAISVIDFNHDSKKFAFVKDGIEDCIRNIEKGPAGSLQRTAPGRSDIGNTPSVYLIPPELPK